MIARRGFLAAMFAACAGPAIVRASSLMPGRVLERTEGGILAPKHGILKVGGLFDPVVSPRLMKGEIFTIAGLFTATGALKQFIVTDIDANGEVAVV